MPGAEPGYICFAAQDWWYHNQAHSDFQLMRQVARHRRVLVVNSIALRMPVPGRSPQAFRRIARKAASMARTVRRPVRDLPNFHVMTPVLLPFYGSRTARALNARLVRGQVRAAARAIGIRDAAIVVTVPTAWEVVAPMQRRALLFNRSDLQSAFPEADGGYVEGLERRLLTHSDRVMYVSRSLMAEDSALVGERAYFLDHGVDLDHFRRRPAADEPADLRAIPHPRLGFFGGFDDYIIDFDLLEQLAREIPEAQLVLIGDATCSMSRFDALPNVHWLGFRPYAQIPAYGSGFDVALMPWLKNEWIKFSNPIKLKEYLALDLPVVSTEFPEADHYRDVIDVAEDADDFVVKVRRALEAGRPADGRLRASVASASWESRGLQLMRLAEGDDGTGQVT